LATLSVIVITKNETHNIQACLEAVAFADQCVVLDSGSSDNTCELARTIGAEVTQSDDWQGFGVQKNRAVALARCDWILSIDADEVVTPALAEEIKAVLASNASTHQVYDFPRLSSYCGQYIHHSGWYPDRIARLFKRGSAEFSDDLVHERLITKFKIGHLRGKLLHQSVTDFEEVLHKTNLYSSAGAQLMFQRGKRASPFKALLHGGWTFIRCYFLRLGFLDGSMGLVLAISNAEACYYRYLKLWLKNRQQNV
jgi:glycosyltransferase involved in cell wall biosynthesis